MKTNYSGCGDMEKRAAKMCGGKVHKRQGKHMGGPSLPFLGKINPDPNKGTRPTSQYMPVGRQPQVPAERQKIRERQLQAPERSTATPRPPTRQAPRKSTVTPRPSGPRMPVGRQAPRKSTVTPRPSRRPTRGRGGPRMPRGPMR
jgi:hypothetical protein